SSRKVLWRKTGVKGDEWRFEMSPDGEFLALARGNGVIQIFGTRTGRLIRQVPFGTDRLCWLAISRDAKRLAWGCAEDTRRVNNKMTRIKVYDLCKDEVLLEMATEHAKGRISPSGSRLAIYEGMEVVVVDLSGTMLSRYHANAGIMGLDFAESDTR